MNTSVEVSGPPTQGVIPPDGVPSISKYQSHNLIGITCMLLVLCLMAVAGRLKARRMTKARLGVDDYLALIALVLLVALSIQQFFLAHVLLTITRTSFPDITTFQTLAKVEVASELTYVFLLTAARASILFLYRRVFALTTPWFRIAWCCNLFLALGFFIALLVSLAFECAPKSIATLWNSPSDCHPSHNDPVIIGFLNALIDMLILLLPIKMVWSLQMPRRRKFAVCCIFGLGLAGVAVSIARAVALTNSAIKSPVGAVDFAIWSISEAAVGLLCACLPLLRPIFTNAYKLLSTLRTGTISSFGLQGRQSRPSRRTYAADHTPPEEDDISMWPTPPRSSKGTEIGIVIQSHIEDVERIRQNE